MATQSDFDRLEMTVFVMRDIVARLLGAEARRCQNPDQLLREVSEGMERRISVGSSPLSSPPVELEEMMRRETEWFVAAARSVL